MMQNNISRNDNRTKKTNNKSENLKKEQKTNKMEESYHSRLFLQKQIGGADGTLMLFMGTLYVHNEETSAARNFANLPPLDMSNYSTITCVDTYI